MTTLVTKPNKCIIFDIDGTIADLSHRVHHVQGGKKDWVAFMATLSHDLPIEQTIFLNHMLYANSDIPIFVCSGRSEDERRETVAWMSLQNIEFERLFMRKSGDYRADHIIKREMLEEIRALGYEPWLIFDDRQQVVDMWRQEGLFVLQCDPKRNFTGHLDFKFHETIKYPLTIMVGPSGAGKTSWLYSTNIADLQMVISSDAIREQLCGDFKDQSRNNEVFETMHELATLRLKRGLPVILDATHIRRADRLKAAKIVPTDVPIKYMVFNRPVPDKMLTGGWRNSVNIKGRTLIEQHDQVFKNNLKGILAGDDLPNVTVDTTNLKV